MCHLGHQTNGCLTVLTSNKKRFDWYQSETKVEANSPDKWLVDNEVTGCVEVSPLTL